jgi:hypothetical protein
VGVLKCISELPSPFHQFGLLVALASAWSLTTSWNCWSQGGKIYDACQDIIFFFERSNIVGFSLISRGKHTRVAWHRKGAREQNGKFRRQRKGKFCQARSYQTMVVRTIASSMPWRQQKSKHEPHL